MIHQHIHLPFPPAAFAVQNIEFQHNKYSNYYFSIIIFTTIIIIMFNVIRKKINLKVSDILLYIGFYLFFGGCMENYAALCVSHSAQQSVGPWFCSAVTLWTVGDGLPLDIALAMGSQCHRSGLRGLKGERESQGASSYVADGLNGTGFSSSPGQTVPHGGRVVGS